MHPLHALTASSLAALILACAPARAEPASSWVDPPAKTERAQSEPAPSRPVELSRDAIKTETGSAGPVPGASADGRTAADPRRAERPDHRPKTVASEIDATAPEPRAREWAGAAQRLTGDYLASISAPNGTTLAEAPRFYGSQVRFHGRNMTLSALIAEKRRFARRWPERRYAPRDGSTRTACNVPNATCMVRTIIGFSAESPARAARSQGVAELDLTISFAGQHPVIVSETSRVMRRGSAALKAQSVDAQTGLAGSGRPGGA